MCAGMVLFPWLDWSLSNFYFFKITVHLWICTSSKPHRFWTSSSWFDWSSVKRSSQLFTLGIWEFLSTSLSPAVLQQLHARYAATDSGGKFSGGSTSAFEKFCQESFWGPKFLCVCLKMRSPLERRLLQLYPEASVLCRVQTVHFYGWCGLWTWRQRWSGDRCWRTL